MRETVTALVRAHALAITFASYAFGVIASSERFGLAWSAVLLIAIVWWLRAQRTPEMRIVGAAMALAFALGASGADLARHLSEQPPFAAVDEHHVALMVVVTERPRPSPNGLSTRVRVRSVLAPQTSAARSLRGVLALLEFPAIPHPDGLAGRELFVRARVSLPGGSRNDGEPAQRDVLAEQGVSLTVAAASAGDVLPGALASEWEPWWARLRARCARSVEQRLPPIEASVLEGILWGDRGNLPAVLRQEFSDTGTVHVLTTAGLHLGMFAALLNFVLARSPLSRAARVSLTILGAWAYAAMAGLHVPTIRAATMITVGSIGFELGRGRSPSAILAAAAFAVALPHPLAVLSPSFSMSFACVGGIALVGPALARSGLGDDCGLPHWMVELARTSIAVQIAMWPLQALYFNAFTPWAVLANMAVVPLVGVVMALGGALVCATAVAPWLLMPLSHLASWSTGLLIAIVERFAALPAAHVDVPPPTHAFLIAYWLALGAWSYAVCDPSRMARARRFAPAVLSSLALVYVAPGIAATLDPRLHLDAIDVGQADCLLVRAAGLHAMLVDGGGKLERAGSSGVVAQPVGDVIAQRTVLPFLLRHWVLRLDAVVLTHPHGDHAGGLPLILAHEHVGTLYDSAQLYGGPAYARTLDAVRERRVHYRVARRGESFELGPQTRVDVLAPEMPLLTGTPSDINNNSVVLRVTFGHIAMLLTGDAQAEAEARLLSHGGGDLAADILKVGHHGSAYSSTPAFLAAVHPKVAIISCGRHNMFGHPSPRTLAALRAAGATTYRTDLNGGVSVDVWGSSIVARPSLP